MYNIHHFEPGTHTPEQLFQIEFLLPVVIFIFSAAFVATQTTGVAEGIGGAIGGGIAVGLAALLGGFLGVVFLIIGLLMNKSVKGGKK